jgi:hypothetical protein
MKAGEPHPMLRVATDRWRTATTGGVVGTMSIAVVIYVYRQTHQQALAMVALLAEDQLAGQPDEDAPSMAWNAWRWAGTLQESIPRMIADRVWQRGVREHVWAAIVYKTKGMK